MFIPIATFLISRELSSELPHSVIIQTEIEMSNQIIPKAILQAPKESYHIELIACMWE